MNFDPQSVIVSLVFVICLFLVRHFCHRYREHQKIEEFVEVQLTGGLKVSLNCPPFGLQKVTFSSEGSTTEITAQNMPVIVKQWDMLWPMVYKALDQEAQEYDAREHLAEKMNLTVFFSDSREGSEPKWAIQLASVAGIFSAEITGAKVTDTGATF